MLSIMLLITYLTTFLLVASNLNVYPNYNEDVVCIITRLVNIRRTDWEFELMKAEQWPVVSMDGNAVIFPLLEQEERLRHCSQLCARVSCCMFHSGVFIFTSPETTKL